MAFYFVGWQGYFTGWGSDGGVVEPPVVTVLPEGVARRSYDESDIEIMTIISAFLTTRKS